MEALGRGVHMVEVQTARIEFADTRAAWVGTPVEQLDLIDKLPSLLISGLDQCLGFRRIVVLLLLNTLGSEVLIPVGFTPLLGLLFRIARIRLMPCSVVVRVIGSPLLAVFVCFGGFTHVVNIVPQNESLKANL